MSNAGRLGAAVATAWGREAETAGKPAAAMVDLLEARFGAFDVVIGDQAETDGELASALGARFALVLSGVTTAADLPTTPSADFVAEDIAALVAQLEAG